MEFLKAELTDFPYKGKNLRRGGHHDPNKIDPIDAINAMDAINSIDSMNATDAIDATTSIEATPQPT
jgi:hypothetical protein